MFLPEFALAEGRDQAGIFSPFESLLPLQGGPPRGSEQAGESGVRYLALIRATSIFTIMSGGLITMTGYFGIGLSIQVPIIAAQAVVEHIDISSITAMILFFQTIGGGFFVSGGQTMFTNYIITTLANKAPSVSASDATEIRNAYFCRPDSRRAI